MTVSYKKSRNSKYYSDCMKNEEGIIQTKVKDDYYAGSGKEPPGTWVIFSEDDRQEFMSIKNGQVFTTDEVTGESDVDKYHAIMDGFNPDTGEALAGKRSGTDERVRLHDVVFSPPKSVSVVWGLSNDEQRSRIGSLNFDATKFSLKLITDKIQTREGKDGVIKKKAHTLVSAFFEHGSSRENDMQLHTHCVIANVGFTAEGKATALEMREALRAQGVAGCAHAAYLAWGLREMGFEIEANGKNFEIHGVPEHVMDHFSTRRRRIVNAFDLTKEGFSLEDVKGAVKLIADVEYLAAANGLQGDEKTAFWLKEGTLRGFTEQQVEKIRGVSGLSANLAKRGFTPAEIRATYGQMSVLAAEVRDAKGELTREQLLDLWKDRGEAIGFTEEQIREICTGLEQEVIKLTEEEMLAEIDEAVRDVLETDAVFSEETLQVATLTQLLGQAHPERILQATELYKQRELLRSEKEDRGVMREYFTTRSMLALENKMLQHADRRDGKHVLTDVHVDPRLRPEQVQALQHVTQDQNAVSVVEGTAGAGKTFTARAVAEQYLKHGYQVVGLAGGWKQALNLQAEAALEDGRAITGWLNGVRKGTIPLTDKTLILLDEAGMVGAQQMKDVLEVAEAAGAKVILLGDTLQQKSVAAGDPLRHIVEQNGSIRLDEITRQVKEGDRLMVKALSRGNYEVAGGQIVAEKENGTRSAIEYMRQQGNLIIEKDEEATHSRLINDWLTAKRDHHAWAEANIHNADEKIRKSAERVLESVHGEALMLAVDNKSVKDLNERAHAARLAAGELGEQSLSLPTLDTTQENPLQAIHVGELISLRRTVEVNGKRFSNRELAKVHGIAGDRLILLTESGNVVDMDTTSKDWLDEDGKLQISYGYCVTTNISQGLTVDLTFAKDGLNMAADKAYVNGSRHRLNCKFFVDHSTHYQASLNRMPADEWKPAEEFSNEEVVESMIKVWGRQADKNSTLDFNDWRTMQGAPVNVISESQIAEAKRSMELANQEIERVRQESKIPEAPVLKELPFQESKDYRIEPPRFEQNESTANGVLSLSKEHEIDLGSLNEATKDRFITFSKDGQPVIVGRKEDGTAVATYDLQGNRLGEEKALAERYAPVLSGDPKRVDIVRDGLDALKLRSSQIEEKDRTTIIVSGGRDEALGMPHIREKIEQAQEVRRFDSNQVQEEVQSKTQADSQKHVYQLAKPISKEEKYGNNVDLSSRNQARGHYQSGLEVAQKRGPAKSFAELRSLSGRGMARVSNHSEMLLPNHARGELHQRITGPADRVRRTGDEHLSKQQVREIKPAQQAVAPKQAPQQQAQAPAPKVQVQPRQEIDRMASQAASQRAQAPVQAPQEQKHRTV